MTEFQIGSLTFRLRKMNAMAQLQLSRKIAPLMPPLIPAAVAIKAALEAGAQARDLEMLASMVQPFADALGDMKEEDFAYVCDKCLSNVEFNSTGNSFVPIWASQVQACLFENVMDASVLIRLVVKVIQEQLGGFFSGLMPTVPVGELPKE